MNAVCVAMGGRGAEGRLKGGGPKHFVALASAWGGLGFWCVLHSFRLGERLLASTGCVVSATASELCAACADHGRPRERHPVENRSSYPPKVMPLQALALRLFDADTAVQVEVAETLCSVAKQRRLSRRAPRLPMGFLKCGPSAKIMLVSANLKLAPTTLGSVFDIFYPNEVHACT